MAFGFDPADGPVPLPAVEDRRAPERRSRRRQPVERPELVRTAVSAAFAACGGLAAVFLFFALVGGIDLVRAAAATMVAILLAAVWVAGVVYRQQHAPRTVRTVARHQRERRGF